MEKLVVYITKRGGERARARAGMFMIQSPNCQGNRMHFHSVVELFIVKGKICSIQLIRMKVIRTILFKKWTFS